MKQYNKYILALICLVYLISVLGSQAAPTFEPNFLQIDQDDITLIDTINAQNEFRIGVQAFYRYSFNEAIIAFERANSFRPGEPLILDWLGRAYFRSGFEDTALRQWAYAAELSSISSDEILIRSRSETVRNRRSLLHFMDYDQRFVESGRYPGRIENSIFFRQPVSVLPLHDGTAWVTAYTSNELVRIDVNGLIRQRARGPLEGFDRPYDIVQASDGRLFVSEYRGGRVSVLDSEGSWLNHIGSRGIGDGQFIGPQNMALDSDDYLYVVDYGNRRISKFDPDGTFLFSFGRQSYDFEGFLSPTGIACMDERIFIADSVHKQIYIFDQNGMYIGILVEEGLIGPESIRTVRNPDSSLDYDSFWLLVADTTRVLHIDPDSSIIQELGEVGGRARITGAGMDSNGNILAANFINDEVIVMTSTEDMASGFFVQIDRIVADSFPLVTLELFVKDRRGQPIVGLDQRNFMLTEQNRPVQQQTYLGAAYLSNRYDISVLIERSDITAFLQDDLAAALRDINASSDGLVSVVSAGETPVRERIGGTASALAITAREGNYTPRWRFDLGLRLAATDLLAGEKKRAVVFVSSGEMGELAFDQYSLSELAAYLANNGIALYTVIVGEGQVGPELYYLSEETGGEIIHLFQPAGIGPAIQSIVDRGSGSYALRFRSSLRTNFGRDLLPVEIEVYLMDRSGRDRIGYFAPVE